MEAILAERKEDLTFTDPEYVFATCLLQAPPFPDDGPVHPIATSHGVVACKKFESGWAWIHLNEEEKTTVGLALEARGAEVNQWFYCNLINN